MKKHERLAVAFLFVALSFCCHTQTINVKSLENTILFNHTPISNSVIDNRNDTDIVNIEQNAGLVITASNHIVNQNDTVCVQIKTGGFTNIAAMSFAIFFDSTKMNFLNAQLMNPSLGSDSLGDAGGASSSFNNSPSGTLRFLWLSSSGSGVTLVDSTLIIQLCFKYIGGGGTSSLIRFGEYGQKRNIRDGNLNTITATYFEGSIAVPATIPVELTVFKAYCKDEKTLINWQTVSEQNSLHFELLHSTSPQSGWKTLTTIPSKGNSSVLSDYNYMFDNPTRLTYYRLRQVDRDGSFHYSPTIAVECAGKEHYLKVYPNPTDDFVYLETDVNEGALIIEVYNVFGQRILKKQYDSGFYPIEIPLTGIEQAGTYIVKVKRENGEVVGVKRLVVD